VNLFRYDHLTPSIVRKELNSRVFTPDGLKLKVRTECSFKSRYCCYCGKKLKIGNNSYCNIEHRRLHYSETKRVKGFVL